jgi:UDP-N-acetylmuramoyl-tripeptide--D-alanyl-D-alanine ligase
MNINFQLFFSLIVLLSFINSIRNIAVLQSCWYRMDRLKDLLFYQKQLGQILKPLQFFMYSAMILSIFRFPQHTTNIFLLVFAVDLIYFFRHKYKKPKLNLKSVTLLLLSLVFVSTFYIYGQTIGFAVAAYTLLFPAQIALYSILLAPIFWIAKEIMYRFARIKVLLHPNLKVIAITGSYGKSSTKEFIYELLKDEFKVLKTPKNVNTELGITNLIIKKLKKNHDILLLEMGALKKGEIKKMCKIASPDIAILTAVDPQHLVTFGSFKKLTQAKSEILLHMKSNAKAFVNLDSKGVTKALKYVYSISPLDMRIQTYGTKAKSNHKIEGPTLKNNKLSFRLDKKTFKSNIYGIQFANNLSAAILCAKELGLSDAKIKEKIATLNNNIITTQLIKSDRGYFVLDDSYNSNPVGFEIAIENALQTKDVKKKYLLTSGMYELGSKSAFYHRRVFKKAANEFDVIVLVKPELQKYLPRTCKNYKIAETPQEIIRYLNLNLKSNDILLLEGRTFTQVKKHFTQ